MLTYVVSRTSLSVICIFLHSNVHTVACFVKSRLLLNLQYFSHSLISWSNISFSVLGSQQTINGRNMFRRSNQLKLMLGYSAFQDRSSSINLYLLFRCSLWINAKTRYCPPFNKNRKGAHKKFHYVISSKSLWFHQL